VGATRFEFQHRFWIILAIYFTGFALSGNSEKEIAKLSEQAGHRKPPRCKVAKTERAADQMSQRRLVL